MFKKRILVIGSSMGIGGVEKALLGLVNSYNYNLNEVDLMLTNPEGEFMEYINPEVNLIKAPSFFSWILLPKDRVISSVFKLLIKPRMLYFFIKNVFWGVVHHSMAQGRQRMWNDVISFLPKFEGNYDEVLDFTGRYRQYVLEKVSAEKKCTWVHSDYRVFDLDASLDEKLLRRFDEINCVSTTCKKIFDDLFPHLSTKSFVRLNIIDINFIKSHLTGPGFKDGFTGVRLLDITRIDPNKGLDIAVQVCQKLKQKNLNFRWYILGNDPLGYKDKLEQLIREYGVEDCFILEGFTKNPYPYINEADIIVHFSRFEGRSVSIDEALALNKTIMLTNYPTAKDQITHGVNGYICDFDVENLTQMLFRLMSNVNDKN